ncbi:hypothetical protein K523DRAFT_366574 [Schizophyllum commune Tattone D]|nr:hypothetical protein K523DRAFT_366574 [Schizophyllum commune Tattone D]
MDACMYSVDSHPYAESSCRTGLDDLPDETYVFPAPWVPQDLPWTPAPPTSIYDHMFSRASVLNPSRAPAHSRPQSSVRPYEMMPTPQPYPRAPTPSNDETSSPAPSSHEATPPPNPKLVFRLPNFAFTNEQPAAAPTSINLAPTESASNSTSNATAPTTSTSTRRSAKTRAAAAIKSISAKFLPRPKPSRASSSSTAASASSAAASTSRSTRSSTARSDSAESETTLVTPPRDATEPDNFHWEIEPLPGTVQRPYTLEQTGHWQKVKAYVAEILKSATGKRYKAVDLDPDEVVDRFLEERYERTGIKPTVERSVAKTPAGKKTSTRKGAKRARVVVEPESEDEEDDVEEAEEAGEEHMEAGEQEEDDDDEEYVQEVQQPAARAGTKRKRATTDDDDDDDEPAKPAKDERTNHNIGERIELLRLDEMVIWFGAHHVLCAGCLRIIGTEARWDFYNGGLWHKHKYRNCKGFKRWEEKPPSKEDLMAWQKSRNRCADGLLKVYMKVEKDRRTARCHCERLGLEEERLAAYWLKHSRNNFRNFFKKMAKKAPWEFGYH